MKVKMSKKYHPACAGCVVLLQCLGVGACGTGDELFCLELADGIGDVDRFGANTDLDTGQNTFSRRVLDGHNGRFNHDFKLEGDCLFQFICQSSEVAKITVRCGGNHAHANGGAFKCKTKFSVHYVTLLLVGGGTAGRKLSQIYILSIVCEVYKKHPREWVNVLS